MVTINLAKTKFLKPNNRQSVTGIIVNEKISVPRDFRKKLRQDCYFIQKNGLFEHAIYVKSNNPRSTLENVIGRLSYVMHIMPNSLEWKKEKQNMMYIRDSTF